MRVLSRGIVVALMLTVLVLTTGSGQAVAQSNACLAMKTDGFLKVPDISGESPIVSGDERCSSDFVLIISVRPHVPDDHEVEMDIFIGR
jgi:hypothetical protein